MAGPLLAFRAALAVREEIRVPTAAQMRTLGARLAALLRPGDLVVLTGPLGAGKTTLVQGIGEGLGVRGPVTSPTFVIARVHPSLCGGPALVHADAYRLGGRAEVDDLDLDADLDSSVTVVEWGEGMVEELASSFLQVTIARAAAQGPASRPAASPAASLADAADEPRTVSIAGTGDRWEAAAAAADFTATFADDLATDRATKQAEGPSGEAAIDGCPLDWHPVADRLRQS